jgi:4-alpha-glucanotransferase
MPLQSPFPRSSGILLHITSLPGSYGIGDFGVSARHFIEQLAEAGQSFWQVLPLGPTGYGDSPYQTLSSFAGNTNLIDLDQLSKWLPNTAFEQLPNFSQQSVDYDLVIRWREKILSLAYVGFAADGGLRDAAFTSFCAEQAAWLDEYALFAALKEAHELQPWTAWPIDVALREPQALELAREALQRRMTEHRFRQWIFMRQWQALRGYAHQHGIRIFGDLPIYVAHDSCDVWSHRELFDLDEHGQPRTVAGVPPDYFSATGQLWGNPLYRWEEHARTGYTWWIHRILAALDQVDLLRIDHFRAFYDYWRIPAPATTAQGGQWVDGPRDAFFDAIRAALQQDRGQEIGEVIVAEDLGDNMAAVRAWRDTLGLAGMKILQFAFGDNAEERQRFTPQRFDGSNAELAVMYVGTHDNNTVVGWWEHDTKPEHRQLFQQLVNNWYKQPDHQVQSISWELITIGASANDQLFMIPLQDVLGSDQTARMNQPGVPNNNWRWRCTSVDRTAIPWERLADITRQSRRWPE